LHTLMPIEEFKAVLGIDDREDKLTRFCLVTATCTIEQYCMRRLILKGYVDLQHKRGSKVQRLDIRRLETVMSHILFFLRKKRDFIQYPTLRAANQRFDVYSASL
jgi:hypothetical protein